MKIDAYHEIIESIQKTQDEGWYDSNYREYIQGKSQRFCDTIHIFLSQSRSAENEFWQCDDMSSYVILSKFSSYFQ